MHSKYARRSKISRYTAPSRQWIENWNQHNATLRKLRFCFNWDTRMHSLFQGCSMEKTKPTARPSSLCAAGDNNNCLVNIDALVQTSLPQQHIINNNVLENVHFKVTPSKESHIRIFFVLITITRIFLSPFPTNKYRWSLLCFKVKKCNVREYQNYEWVPRACTSFFAWIGTCKNDPKTSKNNTNKKRKKKGNSDDDGEEKKVGNATSSFLPIPWDFRRSKNFQMVCFLAFARSFAWFRFRFILNYRFSVFRFHYMTENSEGNRCIAGRRLSHRLWSL